jgi:hypothetical protein
MAQSANHGDGPRCVCSAQKSIVDHEAAFRAMIGTLRTRSAL